MKVIVDIDNTLWDFASAFCQTLRRINPRVPPVAGWTDYHFWRRYVTEAEFNGALLEVHYDQERQVPYPGARPFLEALRSQGTSIVIASHREEETRSVTERWLRKHDFSYEELHVLEDKSELFQDAVAVVDDSPVTLDKARRAGILHTGLIHPWNRGLGYPLFATLDEVLGYLEEALFRRPILDDLRT